MQKSNERDESTPVIVGTAQLVQREVDPAESEDPIRMVARLARQAAEDAGGGGDLLRDLDTIGLVNLGGDVKNPARLVAECLGVHPATEIVTEMGGQIGLTLANHAAGRIAAGESRVALVGSSSLLRTLRKARQLGIELDWPTGGEGAPQLLGELKEGNNEREIRYGLGGPTDIYPLFENALRAARGLSLDDHNQRIGALFSRFTEVAAKNPYAWFPRFRSPEEIITATPENRMIAFPYTKYLNAVLYIDQAAALLMTSVAHARSLGIPEDKLVYWWGGAHSQEAAWWVSERPGFSRCPAMRDAAQGALDGAGVSTDDIDLFDFYSCFPVAVELAAAQLGLAEDDPRGLTVTGGLPYAGGPGSGYCLHAIASMVARLRERPGARGLTTGNGWYLTKHSAAVWGSEPRPAGPPSAAVPAAGRAGEASIPVAREAVGRGCVEAYTVLYDREGAPSRGIVLGRDGRGERFLANTRTDRDLLEAFVAAEQVGSQGRLSQEGGLCRFEPL
jgi:acetyl-CoA C-acetyltransferase